MARLVLAGGGWRQKTKHSCLTSRNSQPPLRLSLAPPLHLAKPRLRRCQFKARLPHRRARATPYPSRKSIAGIGGSTLQLLVLGRPVLPALLRLLPALSLLRVPVLVRASLPLPVVSLKGYEKDRWTICWSSLFVKNLQQDGNAARAAYGRVRR
jgi:hypothetical protein